MGLQTFLVERAGRGASGLRHLRLHIGRPPDFPRRAFQNGALPVYDNRDYRSVGLGSFLVERSSTGLFPFTTTKPATSRQLMANIRQQFWLEGLVELERSWGWRKFAWCRLEELEVTLFERGLERSRDQVGSTGQEKAELQMPSRGSAGLLTRAGGLDAQLARS